MADLAPCFVRPPYMEKVFLTHCIGIPQPFTVMNSHNINVYPDSISCQYKESFTYNRTLASTGRTWQGLNCWCHCQGATWQYNPEGITIMSVRARLGRSSLFRWYMIEVGGGCFCGHNCYSNAHCVAPWQ